MLWCIKLRVHPSQRRSNQQKKRSGIPVSTIGFQSCCSQLRALLRFNRGSRFSDTHAKTCGGCLMLKQTLGIVFLPLLIDSVRIFFISAFPVIQRIPVWNLMTPERSTIWYLLLLSVYLEILTQILIFLSTFKCC